MLLNPLAKVKVRMLMPIMVDLGKIMMNRKGGPKRHHNEEQNGQGY